MTPPPRSERKTAEEVAAEVLEKCWERTELSKPPSAKRIITEALTQYAEERVKEALCDENPDIKEYIDGARYDALDEAAKRIERAHDESQCGIPCSDFADMIRALKGTS